MKILVTGFDPFGGELINPASEAVKRLPDSIDNVQIVPLIVPTVFHKSIDVIEQAIIESDPDLILSIGQAGGRKEITVERVAINVDDARICDNEGNQLIDEPVIKGGPAAYFSTLPIKAMVHAMNEKRIPASVSNTAGTFVCNHVMYGILHLCATKYPNKRAGFIHIPFLPEQTKNRPEFPSMELDVIVQGIEAAISAAACCREDVKITAGKEH